MLCDCMSDMQLCYKLIHLSRSEITIFWLKMDPCDTWVWFAINTFALAMNCVKSRTSWHAIMERFDDFSQWGSCIQVSRTFYPLLSGSKAIDVVWQKALTLYHFVSIILSKSVSQVGNGMEEKNVCRYCVHVNVTVMGFWEKCSNNRLTKCGWIGERKKLLKIYQLCFWSKCYSFLSVAL